MSGCPEGGSSSTFFQILGRINDSGSAERVLTNTEVQTVEFTRNTDVYVIIRIIKGATVENLTFKPMLEVGSTAHEYKPYSISNAGLQKQIDEDVVHNSNISSSSSITETGKYALDATEKNASKKGTMAYEISSLKISVTNLKSSAARPTLVDTEKFMFLGTPIIIKNNNIGTLQACVKMNAVYTSGNAVLQLPTGYRGGISNVACLVSGENSGVTGVTADENGKIKFTSNISANTWVYINITYQITT